MADDESPLYLFKFLLLANMCLYLEAGAVPAMLLQISSAFSMPAAIQGLLGGMPYLSLGIGSPFAGYLMKHCNHQHVIGAAILCNNLLTLLWALTPVDQWYSMTMFLTVRFLMGLMQCVVCVFMPLWTNEFAPRHSRTKWMGALQASVPFGVMGGYIIAASVMSAARHEDVCYGLLCWRWPLLIEWALVAPFCIAVFFVPPQDMCVNVHSKSTVVGVSTSDVQLSSEPIVFSTPPRRPLSCPAAVYAKPGELGLDSNGNTSDMQELRDWKELQQYAVRASLYSPMTTPETLRRHSTSALRNSDIDTPSSTEANVDYESLSSIMRRSPIKSPDENTYLLPMKSRLTIRDSDSESDSEDFCTSSLHSSENSTWYNHILSIYHTVAFLLMIPVYRYLLLGVQFWGTSYMLIVLKAPQPLVNLMFVVCAASGPTLGVLVGGAVVDRFGGYRGVVNRVTALRLVTTAGFAALCCAGIASMVRDFYFFVGALWLILFFGGSVLPSCSGILVSIVPRKQRPISSSLCLLTFNLFGYFLSVVLSGLLMQAVDSYFPTCDITCSRRLGFRLVLLWSFWSFLFLYLAYTAAVWAKNNRSRRAFVRNENMPLTGLQ